RGARQRAALPRDRVPSYGAAGPAAQRPHGSLQHRARQGLTASGARALRRGVGLGPRHRAAEGVGQPRRPHSRRRDGRHPPARLAQILINLVDNAVKYTPEGGWVTVRARRDGGRLEVRVRDTGIGIPRADLPRITERFYRVDKARSRELAGTGLGLAIVKHLVLAHGGELEITSEEGEGTTVRFTLAADGAGADQLALPMEPPGA